MITFKQQITVPEELVTELAVFLGYEPTLIKQITVVDDDTTDPVTTHFEEEKYPNPESAEQYVDRFAKEHTANFFKPFGDKLVQDELVKLGLDKQKKQAQTEIELQLIAPVMKGLTTEVIKSESQSTDE